MLPISYFYGLFHDKSIVSVWPCFRLEPAFYRDIRFSVEKLNLKIRSGFALTIALWHTFLKHFKGILKSVMHI